ncbi:MAG: TetR/AcrR family transcriptional regulator [Bacilli bacterium]|nr:TetR/AcrR family transcriptional regulator [Bacilli bacterium]
MRNIIKDEKEMKNKRELMIQNGFKLFASKGIENVSMQEIADECKIGVATLYRYYNTKLDLVLDIGTRMWSDFGLKVQKKREELKPEDMDAYHELDFYLDFYIDLYANHKDLLRFNQEFNIYIVKEHPAKEKIAPYVMAISTFARMFHNLYEKGKIDKTIKTDLSEEKMFASTCHIMMAVIVRYAQGLLYQSVESDKTEEVLLLKKMILNEFKNE